MRLSDLMAFVRAGYKPGEIKELLELTKDDKPEGPAEIPAKEQEQPEPEKAEPSSGAGSDDQIQQMQQKIQELETKLTAAQKQNTQKDISGDVPDDSKEIEDLVRSFM